MIAAPSGREAPGSVRSGGPPDLGRSCRTGAPAWCHRQGAPSDAHLGRRVRLRRRERRPQGAEPPTEASTSRGLRTGRGRRDRNRDRIAAAGVRCWHRPATGGMARAYRAGTRFPARCGRHELQPVVIVPPSEESATTVRLVPLRRRLSPLRSCVGVSSVLDRRTNPLSLRRQLTRAG